jgi:hypothetical protein
VCGRQNEIGPWSQARGDHVLALLACDPDNLPQGHVAVERVGYMPELRNSQRSLLQATYTPIQRPDEPRTDGRAWEKWSLLASLDPQPAELVEVRRRGRPDDPASGAIDAAEALSPLRFTTDVTRSVASLAPVDPAALLRLGERLVALRAESMAAGVEAQQRLLEAYLEAHGGSAPEGTEPEPTVPDGWERVGELALPEERGAVYQFQRAETASSGGDDPDVDDPDGPSRLGAQRQTTAAMLVPDRTGGVSRPAAATDPDPTVADSSPGAASTRPRRRRSRRSGWRATASARTSSPLKSSSGRGRRRSSGSAGSSLASAGA